MSSETDQDGAAPRGLLFAAFAAIYLIWGSTYLGIRFAVETLPPFLMGAGRFLIAGLLLYAWLRRTGTAAPARSQWTTASIAGALMLGIGNGGVNWAEQQVPSGLTALIIAGTPVWFAIFEWLRPGGARPAVQTIVGIGVGTAGVALLVGSRESLHGAASTGPGIAALVLASAGWAAGSLYSKYKPTPVSPLMAAAQQMITGGAMLLVAGIALGETRQFQWSRISTQSAVSFVYLTIFGSLVGFSTFAWLLKNTTPARLSTYAYINPVVAVFLGWTFGGESLTGRMLCAAVIIVFGVIIITTRRATGAIPSRIVTPKAGSASTHSKEPDRA